MSVASPPPAGGAAVHTVVVVNYSTKFTPANLAVTVAGLQFQASQVCQAWGQMTPEVFGAAADYPVPATGVAAIGVFDSSSQAAGVLGFHSTDPNGEPYGSVFVDPIIANSGAMTSGALSVSVTLGHELAELLGDPGANRYASDAAGNLWCLELADAVEDDAYNVNTKAGNVSLSNFLLPAAFDPGSSGPYDHMGVTTAPFQIAPGGYSIVNGSQVWSSEPASRAVQVRREMKVWAGSRTSRRVAAWPSIAAAVLRPPVVAGA